MRAQRIVASFSTLAQYGTYFFIHLFISISVSYKENKWSSRKGNALFSIMKQIFFIFLIMTFFIFFEEGAQPVLSDMYSITLTWSQFKRETRPLWRRKENDNRTWNVRHKESNAECSPLSLCKTIKKNIFSKDQQGIQIC